MKGHDEKESCDCDDLSTRNIYRRMHRGVPHVYNSKYFHSYVCALNLVLSVHTSPLASWVALILSRLTIYASQEISGIIYTLRQLVGSLHTKGETEPPRQFLALLCHLVQRVFVMPQCSYMDSTLAHPTEQHANLTTMFPCLCSHFHIGEFFSSPSQTIYT